MRRYLKNKGTEKAKKLLRDNARSIPQKVDELWKTAEGSIRSVGEQEKVLADTFETTKQGAKQAAQDNALDCVVQACNDIAAGCNATAPLNTALNRNDLPQRLGRQTVKAKLDAAMVCSIGTDGFTCSNCGKSDSWRHLGTQKNFMRNLNTSYDLYVCQCGQRHLHMPRRAMRRFR